MFTEHSIMLVDDDTDLLFLLQKQFEFSGFKTFVCRYGKGLIKQLLDKKITILLLDISMGAVSGSDLCKEIRANKKTASIKILMMSADVDIKQIANNCGANGFVTKPLDMNEVKQTIEMLY